MIKELLYKWFNLEKEECKTCEVLRSELESAKREKERLLDRLLNPPIVAEVIKEENEEVKPLRTGASRFIPSIVRQQMMESEDRKTLEILEQRHKEIRDARTKKLEKEIIGETDAGQISKTI